MGRKNKVDNTQEQGPSELELRCEGVTDASKLEPVTLGVLRKEKIGNPLLAIELFVMLIVVLLSAGAITSSLTSPDGFLHKLVYGVTGIDAPGVETVDTGKEVELDGRNLQKLTSDNIFRYKGNIIIEKLRITENFMEGEIYTRDAKEVNLDEVNYYLVIYPGTEQTESNVQGAFKLQGVISGVRTSFKYTLANVQFNSNLSYYGKMVEMDKTSKYPEHPIETDEAGIGTLTCSKDFRKIVYTFKNGYLITINDNVNYLHSKVSDDNVYLKDKKDYENKKNKYGDIASVEETSDGFMYICNIDLEAEGFKYPDDNDPDYYSSSLSGESNDVEVIHYAMTGKGYDCK